MVQNKKYTEEELRKLQREIASPIFDPLPLMFKNGKGAWLIDMNGKKYLDCLSAYGAVNQGHCHKKIFAAMVKQAKKLTITSGIVFNDKTPLFYKKLKEISGFDSILQMNSGSEAIEASIKLMRKWGYVTKKIPKNKAEIIVCTGNYHGRTTTIDGFSSERKRVEKFGPFCKGFKQIHYGNSKFLEKAITNNTCGFLIEPIQCENGLLIPPKGYLRSVSKICKKNNILLCVDEIQTGLGRTGKLFCFQYEGIKPDIVTIGKSLSGGFYPISAVLSSKKVMNVLKGGDHGGTFINNPLSAVIGIAALDILVNEKLCEKSYNDGDYLLKSLKKIFKESKIVINIWGRGLLVAIQLNKPPLEYCRKLWKEGVFCKPTHNTLIRIMPPLNIKKAELNFLIKKLNKCLVD